MLYLIFTPGVGSIIFLSNLLQIFFQCDLKKIDSAEEKMTEQKFSSVSTSPSASGERRPTQFKIINFKTCDKL